MQSITFAQIGLFVACLIVLIGVAVGLKLLFSRNPPLHKEYISREEHLATAARIDKERADLALKMDAELGRERGARKQIHQDIAVLQTGVEIVRLQNEEQSKRIGEMRGDQITIRDRIDELPRRTIELLRTSGALK